MKLKFLFVPLVIILIVYLVTGFVIPAYIGPDGVGVARENLAKIKAKLADANVRVENAANLANELNYTADQQVVLRQYLPDKKQDEEVIDSINAIASTTGTSIINIAVKDVLVDAATATAEVVLDDALNAEVPMESLTKNFVINVDIVGDYDKIRNFIVALSSLKRFNDITVLDVSRDASTGGDILTAKITTTFNYLSKVTSVASVDKKIFESGKFDMSIVEEIKNKTNVDVSSVDAVESGRANPFAL